MPKRRLGPGDYEKWKEFQKKFKKMQEEMESLPPLQSPHTSDDDEPSDSEKSEKSVTSGSPTQVQVEEKGSASVDGSSPPIGEKDMHVDQEVLSILGIDDKENSRNDLPIEPALVKCWHKLINQGLKKEDKETLINKYPRIQEFEPKKLNPEIYASISTKHKKKDEHMTNLQKYSGSALMALGAALTTIMNNEDCDILDIVQLLNDAVRLNIEMHHAISISRRANIYIPDLSPQVAELIKKAEIDDTLFGKNLGEHIKESKALTKLTQEIKEKPKPTTPAKKPFFRHGSQQKRPHSQQTSHQRGSREQNRPPFRQKQQYFNRNKRSPSQKRR